MKKQHIQLGSLIIAFSLGLTVRFSQIFVNYGSVQNVQGKNIPGFEIPIVITGLFLLVALLVIRRRD